MNLQKLKDEILKEFKINYFRYFDMGVVILSKNDEGTDIEDWLKEKIDRVATVTYEETKVKDGHNSEAAEADEGYFDAVEEQETKYQNFINPKNK